MAEEEEAHLVGDAAASEGPSLGRIACAWAEPPAEPPRGAQGLAAELEAEEHAIRFLREQLDQHALRREALLREAALLQRGDQDAGTELNASMVDYQSGQDQQVPIYAPCAGVEGTLLAAGIRFCEGETVQVYSASRDFWFQDGKVLHVLPQPCETEQGVTLSAGSVLVVYDGDMCEKWVDPADMDSYVRKLGEILLREGEAVQVYSGSRDAWFPDGRVLNVLAEPCATAEGVVIPAGSVLVVYDGDSCEKWVQPMDFEHFVRPIDQATAKPPKAPKPVEVFQDLGIARCGKCGDRVPLGRKSLDLHAKVCVAESAQRILARLPGGGSVRRRCLRRPALLWEAARPAAAAAQWDAAAAAAAASAASAIPAAPAAPGAVAAVAAPDAATQELSCSLDMASCGDAAARPPRAPSMMGGA